MMRCAVMRGTRNFAQMSRSACHWSATEFPCVRVAMLFLSRANRVPTGVGVTEAYISVV